MSKIVTSTFFSPEIHMPNKSDDRTKAFKETLKQKIPGDTYKCNTGNKWQRSVCTKL